MQLIREHVKEHADAYREKIKRYYERNKNVDVDRHPKVGSRVLVLLSREKIRSRHPKLTFKFDGPYRVVEVTETAALISRINVDEEPVRMQADLLRVCPDEMKPQPLKAKTTRRRKRVRTRVRCAGRNALPSWQVPMSRTVNAHNGSATNGRLKM
ncbi:unnamed protein product [Heligmosomoides polygyrus]|uniref:Reverse transcriptase n=1 Tax=Heligmosomoides polygyrus TaxID=6339 RepID=A0A183GMA8_HELPZ|nr:unnamed protein product [Heligmosomoides polygyrus]